MQIIRHVQVLHTALSLYKFTYLIMRIINLYEARGSGIKINGFTFSLNTAVTARVGLILTYACVCIWLFMMDVQCAFREFIYKHARGIFLPAVLILFNL